MLKLVYENEYLRGADHARIVTDGLNYLRDQRPRVIQFVATRVEGSWTGALEASDEAIEMTLAITKARPPTTPPYSRFSTLFGGALKEIYARATAELGYNHTLKYVTPRVMDDVYDMWGGSGALHGPIAERIDQMRENYMGFKLHTLTA